MYNIIQFGEGNFLRAFAEYYIQTAKNNGVANYSLAICQPRKNNKVISALKMQDNKYNVLIRGRRNGEIINDVMHIDCVDKCIDTTTELDFLKLVFVSNDLKIVISNTTEAGIAYSADDVCGDYYNCTFPAKITYLLHERFLRGADGILFLPVELIENNADELKECALKYADLWQFGDDFKQYVINECSFCNTLVDRIVTGYTEYKDDKCAVACEPYGSWIIQADSRCKQLLPENISNDIVFTNDITPYRTRKVRILNGVHTMSVLAAFLCDIDIVRDMMNDEIFSKYINIGLGEIKQTIDLPQGELDSFASAVLERFNNPFIDHKLLDISLNSVSKFKARCLDTLLDYVKINYQLPKILTFSLAALIAFYMHSDSHREYEVRDSESVLSFFNAQTNENAVLNTLKNTEFWGRDLTEIDNLQKRVEKYYNEICAAGMKDAVKSAVYE